MTLIGHAHFSQFLEWQNLGIAALKHAKSTPSVKKKLNNYRFYLPDFLKFCDNISHKLLRPSQFLEKFLEIPEWSSLQK